MSTILRNDRKALWARFQAFDALPPHVSFAWKRLKPVAERSRADPVNLAHRETRGCRAAESPAAPNGRLAQKFAMTISFSLAHLTVIGLSPPEVVRVAARAGYRTVGFA
jgi:hypothetical protein